MSDEKPKIVKIDHAAIARMVNDAHRQAFDAAVVRWKQKYGRYPRFTWFSKPMTPLDVSSGARLEIRVVCSEEEPPDGTHVYLTGVLNDREVSE